MDTKDLMNVSLASVAGFHLIAGGWFWVIGDSFPTGIRSQNAEPIRTTASTVRSMNSPRRKPVRARNSTQSRAKGSVSSRAARSNLAAAAVEEAGQRSVEDGEVAREE